MSVVDGYSDSFNEHAESLREERKQDDFDNLQHSLSGVETGHQVRHGLSKDTSGSVFGDKRKSSITDQIRETLEWLLLRNPAYAELHQEVMSSLRSAETTVTNALERLLATLEKEQVIFDEMLASAATLPDGCKVFRDKHGSIKTLDGEVVDNNLGASIQWRGDEPSYEDIIQQKNHINNLKEGINELRGIETELGGIRGELTNNEAPPSQERVGELNERIDELQEQAEQVVTKHTQQRLDVEQISELSHDKITMPVIPKTQ